MTHKHHTKRGLAEQATLDELDKAIDGADHEYILQFIINTARESTHATHGTILTSNREGNYWVVRATTHGPELVLGTRIPMRRVAIEEQLSDKISIARSAENASPSDHILFGSGKVKSQLFIPILSGKDVIGMLHVESLEIDAFSEKDVHLLQAVANRAAIALQSAKLPKEPKLVSSSEEITLQFHEGFSFSHRLTPQYIASSVLPYLSAIAEVQHIINEMKGRTRHEVHVISISQKSPITVGLEGAAEAIEVVRETVVPWRRTHAETMARLAEQEKQTEIESKKAEILEKRARAEKDRVEAAKGREEAERLKLENEKMRVELYRAKIELALSILAQISPGLTQTERIAYVVKLLTPLEVIMFSDLEIGTSK